jgi:uncharacterized protein (TIGR00369 family)
MEKAMDDLGVFVDTHTLRFERRLPSSLERAWAYLVEPERLAVWFARGEIEPRLGGRVVIHIEENVPGAPPARGVVTVWDPQRRLAYTWTEGTTESEVSFELSPVAGGVQLVLTHKALPFGEEIGFGAGWRVNLDALALALAGAESGAVKAALAEAPALDEAYAELHRQARAKKPGVYMKDLFQATPFHAYLGLEMTEITADKVSVRVRKTGDLTLLGGALHGGVLAAMVDALGAFHAGMAAQRRLNEAGDKSDNRPFRVRTLGLNVDYLRPLNGDVFTATTTVLHAGSNVIHLRAGVADFEGEMVAAGSASFAY